MDGMRPGTAPCPRRPPPEHWTQVDVILQDMLGCAASAATSSSSSALPQRPHTACVCARPVLCPAASSEEEDSDGGSMDEGLPEELTHTPTARPSASSGQAEVLVLHEDQPAHPARAVRRSVELPREIALLLGGEVFGQAMASSRPPSRGGSEMRQPAPAAAASELPGAIRDVAAKAAAKKLPRPTFLGQSAASQGLRKPGARAGLRGLAPGAARLRSHNSWAHYMPINPTLIPAAAAAGYTAGAASSTAAAPDVHQLVADALAVPVVPAASVPATLEAANLSSSGVPMPALAPPTDEPPKRKRGPKYCVAPGGTRPKNLEQKKVPPNEFMVLEFRTQPRVVPATRAPARVEGRGAALRFRPGGRDAKSLEWAAEREVLTMH